MTKLLSFLIRREDQREYETSDAEFRSLVFANNPTLYNKMFAEPENPVEDAEFIEMQPDNVDELQEMVDEMKRLGAF